MHLRATLLQFTKKSGDGKRGLSTFNEKIEIAKISLKVALRDFSLLFGTLFSQSRNPGGSSADVHFGTFDKCDYLDVYKPRG